MEIPIFILFLGYTISAAVITMLAVVVLMRSPKNPLNRSFFGLSLASIFWMVANIFFTVGPTDDVKFFGALSGYAAATLVAVTYCIYCLALAKAPVSRTTYSALLGVGVVVAVLSGIPGIIATGVDGISIVTNTGYLAMYGILISVFISLGVVVLAAKLRVSRGRERTNIALVLVGLILAAGIALTTNLILPIFDYYYLHSIGPLTTIVFVISSTYAIVRHRMFDIKLAAVRTIAYIGALLTLSGIYYLVAYVLSVTLFREYTTSGISISPVNILIALFLAFIFQPIKSFFDRITYKVFYQSNYDSEEFFDIFGTIITSTADLRELLDRISTFIKTTMRAEHVSFFIYYKNDKEHYLSAGTKAKYKLTLTDAHELDTHFQSTKDDILFTESIKMSKPVLWKILQSYRVSGILPLKRGDSIAGYLLLGDHMRSSYDKRDIVVLRSLRSQIAIAIQNLVSLHEVRELNATLQQKIDSATRELRSSNAQLKHLDEVKDEFMSMASHQLRTPLTSVKGYLSMVLEGDAGEVTWRQRKLLMEAFKSSERMVGLIADFLNVSRLQTGKFVIEKAPFSLSDIVRQEVDDLALIASTHEVKLKYVHNKENLIVNADENKVRQVVMNFIDNAIFYSKTNSTIEVILEKGTGGKAELRVVDTGIGVPKSEQARLFHKFFRAKNARLQRPDGTGVGLYLARRVIVAHGGQLIFKSVEGKGSTFGFKLPLDKDSMKKSITVSTKK